MHPKNKLERRKLDKSRVQRVEDDAKLAAKKEGPTKKWIKLADLKETLDAESTYQRPLGSGQSSKV